MVLGGFAASVALILSGCSPSPTTTQPAEDVTQADIDKAMSTPTKLVYWTWVDGIQDSVDLFEEKYPDIDVEVVNLGSSTEQYPKLRAALQSGKGFPDVFQVGYDYLGSFLQTGSVLNLAPYGAEDLKDQYTAAAWNQVANEDGVWAIPQDSGPIGTLYREDIFANAGLDAAPATWADFTEAARTIKSKTGSYITNLPGNDMPQWLSFLWQAGVKPFDYSGGTEVGIDLNSTGAQEVTAYWQDLVQNDLVSVDADFTDEFYQGLSRGKYASWIVAAWGPLFLQGTVADTGGLWHASEPPQWAAGENVSGNWGGSTNAVTAPTENPIAAYELAKFVNGDLKSTIHLANDLSLFPTTVETLESPDFTDAKSDFFNGQKVNEKFASIAGTVDPDFDFLPFMDYVNTAFNETLGAAIASRGDMVGSLADWQEKVATYAEQQGFTVK
jgi:multiple sugar transport system substrate-binding protein